MRLMVLAAAAKYVETHPPPIDVQDFDKECGVGAYHMNHLDQHSLTT